MNTFLHATLRRDLIKLASNKVFGRRMNHLIRTPLYISSSCILSAKVRMRQTLSLCEFQCYTPGYDRHRETDRRTESAIRNAASYRKGCTIISVANWLCSCLEQKAGFVQNQLSYCFCVYFCEMCLCEYGLENGHALSIVMFMGSHVTAIDLWQLQHVLPGATRALWAVQASVTDLDVAMDTTSPPTSCALVSV